MDAAAYDTDDGTDIVDRVDRPARARWRKKRWMVPIAVTGALAVGLGIAWLAREELADNFIHGQLEAYGLPATYEITSIGPQTQILSNVVIGDPARPDFTAKRVVVQLHHRLGLPTIAQVHVVQPRIYGTHRNGVLSFGTLDKVIFDDTGAAPALPKMHLRVEDGRGLLESDYGKLGLKMEGEGLLDDGFEGYVAAIAPNVSFEGCTAEQVTLYGKLTSTKGAPKFSGPLRLGALDCPDQRAALANLVVDLEAQSNADFTDPRGAGRFSSGQVRYGDNNAAALTGTLRGRLGNGVAAARYTIAARGVQTPQALAAVVTAEGDILARKGFQRIELEGNVEGNGLRLGSQLVAALRTLSEGGKGTLAAPLARQIATALTSETRGSAIEGDISLRKNGDVLTVMAPRIEMRGGSGARILALSRFQFSSKAGETPVMAGNIVTGGPGLPQISGRMERSGGGNGEFRLRMAEYSAGNSSLAVPQITITQGRGGALGFTGRVLASGDLPGGMARGLDLPISGSYVPGGALAVWQQCTEVGFDELVFANLRMDRQKLTLCPPRGGAMLRYAGGEVKLAAGAPSLDLSGSLGETPIKLATGPVGFAWPGTLKAQAVDVTLGPEGTASRFTISDLDAQLGANIAGTFANADIALANVPLDVREAGGRWDYTDGRITLADVMFALHDRKEPDRFEPMAAREARLTMADNVIDALAELRHPASDRVVTTATIRHNLASGTGYANLNVGGLVFDKALQPDQLSQLALGVIANARGTVTGKGRIDWNSARVTSSGHVTTDELDFAAAFGPVKGASGTIIFTDLLNLTTAPGQKLRVASINPGIEVTDGEIEFALRDAQMLAVKGGVWPFMGGTLRLRDVDMTFGAAEERRYIFEIEGLQAAQFVQGMEIENLSATGVFDGTLPIIFDANGNGRIEGGVLVSRGPGGNVSYVGELTYQDLSPMANFAFDALKSLDYTQMQILMDGPLTGEIVTKVRFDGVKQGETAKRNFITRQLAKLPLEFRVNVRAQFYQLLSSMKSLYDPSAVRDPRELGLLTDDGERLRRSVTGDEAQSEISPEDLIPDESAIQN